MAKVHALRNWGVRLARLRQNAALSGGEVVNRLASFGIQANRRSIYAYEAGRIAAPDAGVVWALAKIYGIELEELISTLVVARTGQRPISPSIETSAQESVRVSAEERELLQQI